MRLSVFAAEQEGKAAFYLCCAVLLGYWTLVAFGAWHHTLWGDEADPWVMARETDWHDFLRYFSYTGHPPLWFSVLFPFARAGFPISTMQVINVLFAMAVSWLVLFRSPFSLWFRIGFLFTVGMGFQYAVVTRGYMMMILLMFLLAVLYPRRFACRWRYGMLLALLFNTESFVIVPTAVLAVSYTLECLWRQGGLRRYGFPIGLAGLGALISLLSLLPFDGMENMQSYYRSDHHFYGAFFRNIRTGFFSETVWYGLPVIFPFLHGVPYVQAVALGLGSLLLVVTAALVRRSRWIVFLAAWVGWFYVIFTFLYHGWYWHALLFPVFVTWTLWLFSVSGAGRLPIRFGRGLRLAMALCFLPMLAAGPHATLLAHRDGYRTPYSGSKAMAAYIRQHGYDRQVLVSLVCFCTSSLSGYLPDTLFWITGEKRIAPYIIWGAAQDRCTRSWNILSVEAAEKARTEPLLVIATSSTIKLPPDLAPHLAVEQLHATPGLMERFVLLRVGPARAP